MAFKIWLSAIYAMMEISVIRYKMRKTIIAIICALIAVFTILISSTLVNAEFPQPIKLNKPLPVNGDIWDFYQISSDGNFVVFWGDQDTDEVYELYSVPIAGPASAVVKLNGELTPGGDVSAYFQLSQDGSRVVYRADQDIDEKFEAYSVPINGPASAGVKISGELGADGDVLDFQTSPDSSRVIYKADQDIDEKFEAYSVPINGPASAGVKISGALGVDDDVLGFHISPDSLRVVFTAYIDSIVVNEDAWWLFSVPIDGSTDPVELTHNHNGSPSYITISPDSTRVVYYADLSASSEFHLYSVPTTGPSSENMLIGNEGTTNYQISSDSTRVVYPHLYIHRAIWSIYSTPITGPSTDAVLLNDREVWDSVGEIFQISPDSNYVVYTQKFNGDEHLFKVTITGPSSASIVMFEEVAAGISQFEITRDGKWVIYRVGNMPGSSITELFSIQMAGPYYSPVKLNDELVTGGDVIGPLGTSTGIFEISLDSSWLVYAADQETDGVYEIFCVPVDGPGSLARRLNGDLVSEGNVLSYKISPDNSRVVYWADQDNDNIYELYSVTGACRAFKLYLPTIQRE